MAVIENNANNTVVSGTGGEDRIINNGSNVTINAYAGDDYIYLNNRENGGVKVFAGDGVDTLTAEAKNLYADLGAGDDEANIWGDPNYDSYSTIDGGSGDDYLFSAVSYVTLRGGDGKDTLESWGGNYAEHILLEDTSGSNYFWMSTDYSTIIAGNGNDTILQWGSHSLISLGGGKNSINACATNYSQQEAPSTYNTIIGGKGADTIEVFGSKAKINGGAGGDYISAPNNGDTIAGGAGDDIIWLDERKSKNSVIQFGSGDGADIVQGFNSDDTLQITSGNINSSVVSNNNLTLKVGDGAITLSDVGGTTIKIQLASGQLISLAVPGGSSGGGTDEGDADADSDSDSDGDSDMDGITVSNGTVYVGSDFDGDEIDLVDYSPAKNVYAATFDEDLHILGTGKNNSLVGGKGDDLIEGGAGKDTLTGGRGDDVFVHTGGKDIITDYTSGEDKIQLENGLDDISSTKYSGNNLILTTSTGSITVKGGKGKSIVVVDDQGNEESVPLPLPKYLTYNSNKAMVTAAKNYSGVIDVTAYSQTQKAKIVDASAVTNNVEIIGNTLNNSLVAGSGDDTLYGGKGKDTLTGGTGSDIFIHTGGSDIITDYNVGEDVIQLGDGVEIKSAKLNVKDVILTTNVGTITVKDGKNKKITVADSDGEETTKIYPITQMTGLSYNTAKTVLTVKKTFAGETIELDDYASTVKTVNAKAAAVNVEIIGNKLNNSLIGGAGNDTLGGGSGKDTLTGGKGEDVFVFTAGTDTITDYKADEDKIQLDDGVELKSWKISGSNVIFTTSAGKFIVKNGKNKKITIVDDEGNESTKKYSKAGTATSALFAEDNFAKADDLSAIVENNLSAVSEIETQNFDSLTQENLITYADK